MLSSHREIALVLALFVVLGVVYSMTTPLFEAPDEQWHFAFVQYVATGHGLPVQTPDRPAHLARQEGSQPPLYYLLAAGLTFWIDTSDFPGIVWENPHYGYDVPGIVDDNKNLFIHTSLESFPYHGAILAIHLARFLSVLMGALAVLFTYLLMLEISPNRRYLAASAAAVVGFVPQFLFVSGAVSNDSTIVALAGLSLWLIVRLLVRDSRTPIHQQYSIAGGQRSTVSNQAASVSLADAILLGVATGLAALAKVSGAGLAILGGLALVYLLRRDPRRLIAYGAVFAATVCLVAGWWYLRNWLLYGELTGTAMMVRIFGARDHPLTGAQLLTQLGEVWETFWVGFGWGNIRAQPIIYGMLQVLAAASGMGLVLSVIRRRERLHLTLTKALPFFILALWVVIAFAELLQWMEITQAPHGRLFFPVLPALAPIVVFGLTRWVPERWRPAVARVPAVLLLALAAAAPFTILQPAYAYPPLLAVEPNIARRVEITYGAKIKLLGYDASAPRVRPGDSMVLTLYWQSLVEMDQDYSIGIHLVDSNHHVISSRDSFPGHGMLPTSLWRAGQIIQDTFWVPIAADASEPDIVDIQIDLYLRGTQQDLQAVDPQGQAVTPTVGRLRIAGRNQPPSNMPNPSKFVFGGQAALVGYEVSDSANQNADKALTPSEKPVRLVLYWKRVAPILVDYIVFAHLLDGNGQVVAQMDREPEGGRSPTSLWEEGEVIADAYDLHLPSSAHGPLQIEVGLYRADTSERLPVSQADGTLVGDHVILGTLGAGQ